jgi:hypothetical protein
MAMPDNDFDRWMTEALNAEISCHSPKKQAIWKQIAQKAAQQSVLAAEDDPVPFYPYRSMVATGRRLWNWLNSMAGDETCYDRARLNRHRMYHHSIIGDGSISVHIFEPLHYRWLSPI